MHGHVKKMDSKVATHNGTPITLIPVDYQATETYPWTGYVMVDCDAVIRDQAVTIRGGGDSPGYVDAELVAEYAENIDALPPILLYQVLQDESKPGGKLCMLCVDGFHRCAAHELMGKKQVPAFIISEIPDGDGGVRRPTRRDAILYASTVNLRHGRRPTKSQVIGRIGDLLNMGLKPVEVAKRLLISKVRVSEYQSINRVKAHIPPGDRKGLSDSVLGVIARAERVLWQPLAAAQVRNNWAVTDLSKAISLLKKGGGDASVQALAALRQAQANGNRLAVRLSDSGTEAVSLEPERVAPIVGELLAQAAKGDAPADEAEGDAESVDQTQQAVLEMLRDDVAVLPYGHRAQAESRAAERESDTPGDAWWRFSNECVLLRQYDAAQVAQTGIPHGHRQDAYERVCDALLLLAELRDCLEPFVLAEAGGDDDSATEADGGEFDNELSPAAAEELA